MTGKSQFSFQSQRKAMSKNSQTTTQLHSSHTLSKVILKLLEARSLILQADSLPAESQGKPTGTYNFSTQSFYFF